MGECYGVTFTASQSLVLFIAHYGMRLNDKNMTVGGLAKNKPLVVSEFVNIYIISFRLVFPGLDLESV